MGIGGQGSNIGQSGTGSATPGFALNQLGASLGKLGNLMPQLSGGGRMPVMTNMPVVNVGPNATPQGMNGANPMASMLGPQQRTVSPIFSNVANQAPMMGNVSGGPIASGMSGKPLTPVSQPVFNPNASIPSAPQMPQMAMSGTARPASTSPAPQATPPVIPSFSTPSNSSLNLVQQNQLAKTFGVSLAFMNDRMQSDPSWAAAVNQTAQRMFGGIKYPYQK